VNYTGGLAWLGHWLRNEIWSPVIAWPEQEFDQVILAFDVYRHELGGGSAPGIYYTWHVRSTNDPAGETGWTEWQGDGELYSGGPEYFHHEFNVTAHLLPDCRTVQIALGAWQWVWVWGPPPDPTPAPYFDNVALCAVSGLADVPDVGFTLCLEDPVPNPFNPTTRISFSLPADSPVQLSVYDLRGRLVRSLLAESRPAGIHAVFWNGRDNRGAAAATGAYFFCLEANGRRIVKKGILVK